MAWFVRDVCGIICAILAWLMLIFAQYTLLSTVLLPQPDSASKYLNLVFFELFSILTLIAHIKTVFTDPGSVPQKTATIESSQQQQHAAQNGFHQINAINGTNHKCHDCCSIKPERAHHCSVCKRCIRKMDHHCPWVNNCIGERNQKFFVLFTLYVAVLSFHVLCLVVKHIMYCLDDRAPDWNSSRNNRCSLSRDGRPSPGKLIMLVFLVFEALLFSLFSTIMFSIQMKAIWTDWTGIENLKKEDRDRMSGCRSLRAVCGNNILFWLSPLTSPPPKKKSLITSQSFLQPHNNPV